MYLKYIFLLLKKITAKLTNHKFQTFLKQLHNSVLKTGFFVMTLKQESAEKKLKKLRGLTERKKKTKAFQMPQSNLPIIAISRS